MEQGTEKCFGLYLQPWGFLLLISSKKKVIESENVFKASLKTGVHSSFVYLVLSEVQ